MSEREFTEAEYDEWLNEVHGETVTIAGYEYDTARALKEVDPIAYRVGYNDWTDMMERDE